MTASPGQRRLTVGRSPSCGQNDRDQEATELDDVKRAYRHTEVSLKKGVRNIDGTDLADLVANVGDEVGKDLGNVGDDLRRVGRDAQGRLHGRHADRKPA